MPLEPKLEEITWIGTFTLRVVFSFLYAGFKGLGPAVW